MRPCVVRPCVVRLAAFLLAVLIALPVSPFGGGHAHAATTGKAHVFVDQVASPAGEAYAHQAQAREARAHAVPCDDSGADRGGQDNCCISISACGVCAPLPSAGLTFLSQGTPVDSAPGSASLPRDPPTLRRPPKLPVAA